MPIMAALTGLVLMTVIAKTPPERGFVGKILFVLGSLLFSTGTFIGTLPEVGPDMGLAAVGIVETLAATGMWIWFARRREVKA
jgi:hypothetical protein